MLYEVKRMVGVHDLHCLDNMVIFVAGSIQHGQTSRTLIQYEVLGLTDKMCN